MTKIYECIYNKCVGCDNPPSNERCYKCVWNPEERRRRARKRRERSKQFEYVDINLKYEKQQKPDQ